MIRQSGVEPTIIEYLKTPPSRERLKELIAAMAIAARALLREKDALSRARSRRPKIVR
jgi:arsenate reductase